MDTDLPLDVFDRFLAGEASADDIARVRTWAESAAGDANAADRLLAAIRAAESLDTTAPHVDVDAYVARLRQRLDLPVARRAPRPSRVTRRWPGHAAPSRARRLTGIAASIVAVGAGIALVRAEGWLAPPQPIETLVSEAGSRNDITLRDGTTIILGPGSRLLVPGDFGVASRHVALQGEAVFHAAHNARLPFSVQTARAVVRDVGTTFVIRAYADDAYERIAVEEGEVAIGGTSLKAHDAVSIDSARRILVERSVDVSGDMRWAQGGLVFKGTPFAEAVRDLARTYNLDVTVADSSLNRQRITASFDVQSEDEVLSAITRIVGAHYERKGRIVVIRRGVLPIRQAEPMAAPVQRFAR
ncbi:MAG TPA: FecR domain-containing protein [Gemmatimonadaceae bacterium]|nr:FecR domain-containing protein [Gemmatimonadaceae bacterium]